MRGDYGDVKDNNKILREFIKYYYIIFKKYKKYFLFFKFIWEYLGGSYIKDDCGIQKYHSFHHIKNNHKNISINFQV